MSYFLPQLPLVSFLVTVVNFSDCSLHVSSAFSWIVCCGVYCLYCSLKFSLYGFLLLYCSLYCCYILAYVSCYYTVFEWIFYISWLKEESPIVVSFYKKRIQYITQNYVASYKLLESSVITSIYYYGPILFTDKRDLHI